jgi:glucose/arabinose dehydrogenase
MIIIYFLSILFVLFNIHNIYGQQKLQPLSTENITLYDPNLKLELVVTGLDFPTTMAFLGPDDFLILEKNTGNVKRVVNGTVLDKPLLDITPNKPSIKDERGLLGIAISEKKNFNDNPFFIENRNLTHNIFL